MTTVKIVKRIVGGYRRYWLQIVGTAQCDRYVADGYAGPAMFATHSQAKHYCEQFGYKICK